VPRQGAGDVRFGYEPELGQNLVEPFSGRLHGAQRTVHGGVIDELIRDEKRAEFAGKIRASASPRRFECT
jgi:hypothetical protein